MLVPAAILEHDRYHEWLASRRWMRSRIGGWRKVRDDLRCIEATQGKIRGNHEPFEHVAVVLGDDRKNALLICAPGQEIQSDPGDAAVGAP